MKTVSDFVERTRSRILWSWAGITDAWVEQPSFRSWVWVNVGSIALALYLPLATGERALILVLGVLLLAAEIFNTAIEYTVDYISTERHPLAGKAKDAASAGVFLTAIAGGVA
ncbi:MAG: diacylglycerol kinase [Boseongicola sp.]|nr:MAG: diacylglycerol kinase [Boseongicola sp.]